MKVLIKTKVDGQEDARYHEIEKIDLFQLQKSIRVIKDILAKAEGSKLVHSIIEVLEEKRELPGAEDMLSYMTEGFELLLLELPEHAFQLLSILSGIDHKALMTQKVEDVFDIYDAILEVNDIEALIERGKKSLAVTARRTSWLRKLRKVTAERA